MADKENSVQLIRAAAAKRRAAVQELTASNQFAGIHEKPAKRKRVPLQELPNLAGRPAAAARRAKSKALVRARRRTQKPNISSLPPIASSEAGEDLRPCQPCVSDIDSFLRSMEVEKERRPADDFVETVQKDITASMRGILVDWLVEVAEEYNLLNETLHLTVSYIDRFLSANVLSRQKLQLLGVSCMLIASKYEEINPPHVEDFCYVTDNTYTKQELVKMEEDVLKFLKSGVGSPTILCFLRRFASAAKKDYPVTVSKMEFLCNYLAELSLLDYGCVRFLPSEIAASVIFAAMFTFDHDYYPWSSALVEKTGYWPHQIEECIRTIHDLQLNRKRYTLSAVRAKYMQKKFKLVAASKPATQIPQWYFQESRRMWLDSRKEMEE